MQPETTPDAGNLTTTSDRMTAAATQVGNQIAIHLDQDESHQEVSV